MCNSARLCNAGDARLASDRVPYQTLDLLSTRIVESDSYLGRTRVAIKSGTSIQIDITPDQAALLEPENTNVRLLDVLVRSKALQRDLAAAFPGETFWAVPLRRIETTVVEISNPKTPSASSQEAFRSAMREIEGEFEAIQQDALTLARKRQIDADSSREPAAGYKVDVRIDPPKARVRYMPLLFYLLYRNTNRSLEDQWTDLPQGVQHLIGKYHYIAEWPAELNGTVEGNFQVREDSVVTFTPKNK